MIFLNSRIGSPLFHVREGDLVIARAGLFAGSRNFINFATVKGRWSKIITAMVMAVFVNFMFSNVIFLHLHKDAQGRAFLHSHPYLPKAPHHHDSHSLDLIAAFNAAAEAAEASATPALFAPAVSVETLIPGIKETVTYPAANVLALRGPPCMK